LSARKATSTTTNGMAGFVAPPLKREGVAASEPAACPECSGHGYVVDEHNVARPCNCGLNENLAFRTRLAAAGIPNRFNGKGFKDFRAQTNELKQVCRTAESYAEGFDRSVHDGIMMRGRTGCGKTHLAVAILCEVIRRGHTGRFWNFQELLARLRESYNNANSETEGEILDSIANADLVVLDDLGSENTTDWVRDRLYLIVNRRYESEKPMVITTNCSESELDQRIGQRTASRFYEMCGLPFPNFPDADWRRAQMR